MVVVLSLVSRLISNKYIGLLYALAGGAVVGLVAMRLAPSIVDWSAYRLYLLGFMAVGAAITLIVGNVERLLVLGIVFIFPFMNMAFAPFDKSIPPHSGGARAGVILYIHDLLLIVLIAIGILNIIIHRTKFRFSILDLAMLSFVFWGIVSTYNSVNLPLSIAEIIRTFKFYILARVVTAYTQTKLDVIVVFAVLMVGMLVQTLISVLQYYGIDLLGLGFATIGDVRRITGTFGWPNTLGAYFAAVVTIGLTFWICNAAGKLNNVVFLVSAAGILPLLLTFSRGSWLALGIGIMTTLLLAWVRGWLTLAIVPKLVFLALPGVGVIIFFWESIMARMFAQTVDVRFQLNEVAYHMIEAHPAIGIGINTYILRIREFDTQGVWFAFREPVHNIYLLVASEMGLMGLLAFFVLLVLMLWESWQAAQTDDRFLSAFAIGICSALVTLAWSNIADVHLRTEGLFCFFAILLGIIMALRRIQFDTITGNSPGMVGWAELIHRFRYRPSQYSRMQQD